MSASRLCRLGACRLSVALLCSKFPCVSDGYDRVRECFGDIVLLTGVQGGYDRARECFGSTHTFAYGRVRWLRSRAGMLEAVPLRRRYGMVAAAERRQTCFLLMECGGCHEKRSGERFAADAAVADATRSVR